MNDRLQQAPIGVIETTRDGQITDINQPAAELIDDSPTSVIGTAVSETFPRSAAGTLREIFTDNSVTSRSFEEYYPPIERWLAVDVEVDDGVVVFIRDRTEIQQATQTVDRLERRLDQLQRIDSLVVTVLEQLISAPERAEVGQVVCDRLGGTDLYAFAWAGERNFAEDRTRIVAAAGSASDMREQVNSALENEQTVPGQRAVETGEPQLVEPVAGDETISDGVREMAFKHGLQSCLAIPLVYQDTVYGVVSVFSAKEEGFSEQERVGLEVLGSVAGFVIRAMRQEDLLVADTVTEVTVDIDDETVPFVRAARHAGIDLSLKAAVPRRDGTVVCYIAVTDAEAIVEQKLTNIAAITDLRWIRSKQDPLLQVTVEGQTPVTTLTDWGAKVDSAEYSPQSARLVTTAPPEGNVREMIETLDATVAETNLVAKARQTRDSDSVEAFRDAVDEQLTEQQRTVLQAAYLSDYFESPRGSTSAEVAESLGITGPTMLYHLRRAEQKLIGIVLAEHL